MIKSEIIMKTCNRGRPSALFRPHTSPIYKMRTWYVCGFILPIFVFCRNLYASEANQMYVSLLLEMFSNIIQYQYVGNAHLVYAIVRRRDVSVDAK